MKADSGKFSLKLAILAVLIIASLFVSGCTQSSGEAKVPVHPDSESFDLPSSVNQNVKSSVSQNATVDAYTSEAPTGDMREWYGNELPDRGWTKTQKRQGFTLWTEDDMAINVTLISTQHLPGQLGVPESAQTLIIVVEANASAWESALTQITGSAVAENGSVSFTAGDIYPSTIAPDEYQFEIIGLRGENATATGNVTTVKEQTQGTETLENGATLTIQAEGVEVGDYLVFNYSGQEYPVPIQSTNGSSGDATIGGSSGGSPH